MSPLTSAVGGEPWRPDTFRLSASTRRRVTREGRRLGAAHQAAGAVPGAAFRTAADPPYERPGRLARAVSGIKAWVRDHADVLTQVATVLRGVSAALGTV